MRTHIYILMDRVCEILAYTLWSEKYNQQNNISQIINLKKEKETRLGVEVDVSQKYN